MGDPACRSCRQANRPPTVDLPIHQSPSFSPVVTDLNAFTILRGEEILTQHADASSTATGYLTACREEQVEAVPLVLADATPSGPITEGAFTALVDELVELISERGPWDAVPLSLNGAAVADGQADADGEILRRIREIAGRAVPIVATLDMHANVSTGMVEQADGLVVWKTNPHVDAAPVAGGPRSWRSPWLTAGPARSVR